MQLSKSTRKQLSYLRAQFLTFSGLEKRGFFTQYDYVSSIADDRRNYPAVEAHFARASDDVEQFISAMASDLDRFQKFGEDATDPVWFRGMFSPLDGAAAYTATRLFNPTRVIEIGSGDSTHYLAKSIKDNNIDCEITCIDPQPRRSIKELGTKLLQRVLTTDDVQFCATLEANDILFIDSSHIMLPNMDVDIQFNRIFPELKKGVVVHVHDIFLPDQYPVDWQVRNYSEQNALAGWILSGYFDVIYPGYYAATRHKNSIAKKLAVFKPFQDPSAGSIWLRKRAD